MSITRWSFIHLIFFVIVASLMLILTSCVSLRQAAASRQLNSLVDDLSYPTNAVILETVKGVDGGSDKQCYTLYVRQLYGTNQHFDEILTFYENQLISEETWQVTSEPRDRSQTSFNHNNGFRLGVAEVTEMVVTSFQKDFSEDIVIEGLNNFLTLYSIDVDYADATTRARCWVSGPSQ